jgi:hypothetical protein
MRWGRKDPWLERGEEIYNIPNGQFLSFFLLDLPAAFDTVGYSFLLEILNI